MLFIILSVIVALLNASQEIFSDEAFEIYVNTSLHQKCDTKQDNVTCGSLQDAFNYNKSKIKVFYEDIGQIYLEDITNCTNKEELTLIGMNANLISKIVLKEPVFQFKNIQALSISNITFSQYSMGVVLIQNCSNVIIEKFTMNKLMNVNNQTIGIPITLDSCSSVNISAIFDQDFGTPSQLFNNENDPIFHINASSSSIVFRSEMDIEPQNLILSCSLLRCTSCQVLICRKNIIKKYSGNILQFCSNCTVNISECSFMDTMDQSDEGKIISPENDACIFANNNLLANITNTNIKSSYIGFHADQLQITDIFNISLILCNFSQQIKSKQSPPILQSSQILYGLCLNLKGESQYSTLIIKGCNFDGNVDTNNHNWFNSNISISSIGPLISLRGIKNVLISENAQPSQSQYQQQNGKEKEEPIITQTTIGYHRAQYFIKNNEDYSVIGGGGLYLDDAYVVNIINTSFIKLQVVTFVNNSQQINQKKINYNLNELQIIGGFGGGIFADDSCLNLTLTNVSFSQCQALGTLEVDIDYQYNIRDIINNNYYNSKGGAIFLYKEQGYKRTMTQNEVRDQQVILYNVSFINCSCQSSTKFNSSQIINQYKSNLYLITEDVDDCGAGGIYSYQNLDMHNCSFIGCTAELISNESSVKGSPQAVFIIIEKIPNQQQVLINGSHFISLTSKVQHSRSTYSNDDKIYDIIGPIVKIIGANQVILTAPGNNEINEQNNSLDSYFHTHCLFANHISTVPLNSNSEGGGLSFINVSNINISSTNFSQLAAPFGGGIYFGIGLQSIYINYTQFDDCRAYNGSGGGIFIFDEINEKQKHNEYGEIIISSVSFNSCSSFLSQQHSIIRQNNISQIQSGYGGGIASLRGINASQCNFIKCNAHISGSAIYVNIIACYLSQQSDANEFWKVINIEGCLFDGGQNITKNANMINNEQQNQFGSLIQIITAQTVIIQNDSNLIYNSKNQRLNILKMKNKLIRNDIKEEISMPKFDYFNCIFKNYKAECNGSAINVWNASKVYIIGTKFEQLQSQSSSEQNEEEQKGFGGAIYIQQDCQEFQINQSSFVNCTSDFEGGAIFAESIKLANSSYLLFSSQQNFKEKVSNKELYYFFSNNVIYLNCSCKNGNGGAIFSMRSIKLTESNFNNCIAQYNTQNYDNQEQLSYKGGHCLFVQGNQTDDSEISQVYAIILGCEFRGFNQDGINNLSLNNLGNFPMVTFINCVNVNISYSSSTEDKQILFQSSLPFLQQFIQSNKYNNLIINTQFIPFNYNIDDNNSNINQYSCVGLSFENVASINISNTSFINLTSLITIQHPINIQQPPYSPAIFIGGKCNNVLIDNISVINCSLPGPQSRNFSLGAAIIINQTLQPPISINNQKDQPNFVQIQRSRFIYCNGALFLGRSGNLSDLCIIQSLAEDQDNSTKNQTYQQSHFYSSVFCNGSYYSSDNKQINSHDNLIKDDEVNIDVIFNNCHFKQNPDFNDIQYNNQNNHKQINSNFISFYGPLLSISQFNNASLLNCIFSNYNTSNYSPATGILINNILNQLSLDNVSFINLGSRQYDCGSALSIDCTVCSTQGQILLSNLNFTDCATKAKGGAINIIGQHQYFLNNKSKKLINNDKIISPIDLNISIYIKDSTFSRCYAFDSGGAIFTQNSIGISNSIFGGCQAIQGNSIHIQRLSKDISLLINGSVFTGRDIYNETQYQLYSAPVYAERIKNIVITTMTEEGIVGETEGLKSNFSFFIKKDNQNQQYNQDNQFNGICGGVQIYSAEQIFFNGVVFSDIQADQGSALRIEVSVKVTLHNCEFIKCKSNGNGAVYFQIDPLIPSINLISIDCKFQECQSNQSGGAIYIEQQSKLQRNDYFSNIKNNNELQANRFSNDIDEDQESLFTISADFVQNSAQNQGGAVFIAPNIDETLSLRLKFDRCIFMHNFAADKGGSVFMDVNQSRNQFISFDFCFFIANNCSGITQNEQPDDYTRCAGGIFVAGAKNNNKNQKQNNNNNNKNLNQNEIEVRNLTANVSDCYFMNNTNGGIIMTRNSYVNVQNSLFAINTHIIKGISIPLDIQCSNSTFIYQNIINDSIKSNIINSKNLEILQLNSPNHEFTFFCDNDCRNYNGSEQYCYIDPPQSIKPNISKLFRKNNSEELPAMEFNGSNILPFQPKIFFSQEENFTNPSNIRSLKIFNNNNQSILLLFDGHLKISDLFSNSSQQQIETVWMKISNDNSSKWSASFSISYDKKAQQLLAWHIALIALGALTVVGITLGLIIFLSFRWIKRRKREGQWEVINEYSKSLQLNKRINTKLSYFD